MLIKYFGEISRLLQFLVDLSQRLRQVFEVGMLECLGC